MPVTFLYCHLKELQEMLLNNPQLGDVIKGTGGLRKMRYALPNRGKSGSSRVLYVDFVLAEKIYLIFAYPKNERDNLTDEEKNNIRKMIEKLEKTLQEGHNMKVYEGIMQGLEEAVAYNEGKIKAKTTKISIEPVPELCAQDIKDIRKSVGMTQVLFATLMGVSKKTVEAWESGRNKPEGPAMRMLAMFKIDPTLPQKMNIVNN